MSRPFTVSDSEYPFASRWLESGSGALHYVDEGSGPAVLFLHGNPTWSYLYRSCVRRLRERLRCVAPDYPGFGYSKAPEGYRYRPRDHARWIDRLLDRVGPDRFVLVAHDWGGPIGLSVAGRRPEAVRGIVLANTWCWAPDARMYAFSLLAGSRAVRPLYRWANPLAGWILPLALRGERRTASVRAAYAGPFRRWERRMATWIFPHAIRTQAEWVDRVRSRLDPLAERPVELVWGRRDPILGRRAVRDRWKALFPRARVRTLDDAGHFVPEDRPDAIADAVTALLNRLDG